MRVTKTKIVLISLLSAAIVMAIISMVRAHKLNKELIEVREREGFINNVMASQKKLQRIDSMLVKGQYRNALKAYQDEFNATTENDPTDVRLRIELAQQLMHFSEVRKPLDSMAAKLKEKDSLLSPKAVSPKEIRTYDSIRFALEKAKVQINRMKKQLRNSSSGAYLTFKNTKKHQLHYVGQVRNNKANGFGIAILDTGSRYEGDWQNNLRHGEGSFYWVDGEKYIGQYQNDRRNGTGTYFWPNGEKYVGQWKDDQRDGEGIFYAKDGKIITQGVWKNDKLVKQNKGKKK